MPDTPELTGSIDLSEAERQAWKDRIGHAQSKQKTYHKWWDQALKNYSPSVKEDPDEYRLEIRTNRTYTLVERKRAELFFQRPELMVAPSPLLEAQEGGDIVASAHGAILNERLGLDGVHIKGVARQAIFDYLLFGAGWTKMGYRSFTTIVEQEVGQEEVMGEDGLPVMEPDPESEPMFSFDGIPLPQSQRPVMQPKMAQVPVTIKGETFWECVSPRQMLIPADYKSIEMDQAPWLGMTFEMPLLEARRLYGKEVQASGKQSESDGEQSFEHGAESENVPSTKTVRGTEIWYKSSLYREDVVHPDHLTQMVMIEGLEEPVQHRDSPYQALDPATGKLTPQSMLGFPFHPLIIRPLTDSSYIMSDVAVALPLTQELDKFREQMITQRDINSTKYYYNTDTLPRKELEKILQAPQGGMIGLPAEAFTTPGGPIQPMPHGPYPRENFEYNDYIDNDLARTHAIDATGAGTSAESGLTATEANLRQQNVNIRLGAEQGFVADWLVLGATKFSSLLQQFMEPDDAAAIVGPEQAALWDQWRQAQPTRLAFTMLPDSSLKNDTPLHRKQLQELFTYLANDPSLNRAYLTKKLLHAFHLDPSKAILPPDQVPQPGPDPSNVSISVKGDDLNPMSPQMPIMLDVLKKAGIEVDPAAVQQATQVATLIQSMQQTVDQALATGQAQNGQGATQNGQPPHGGKLAQAESLDKHQSDLTGGMQGSGVLSEQMSGGGPRA